MEEYRELLDRQKCWQARAEFDVARCELYDAADLGETAVPSCGVSAMCNFCNQSFEIGSLLVNTTGSFNWLSKQAPSLLVCPRCKKALPRCSICLKSMPVMNPFHHLASKDRAEHADNVKIAFDDWFVWCQSCRHGGHTRCLAEWFGKYDECPVNGCSCKCSSL